MRCDRYGECSALTGELTDEVFEDIARTAAKTTTEVGGLSSAPCNVMLIFETTQLSSLTARNLERYVSNPRIQVISATYVTPNASKPIRILLRV